MTPSKRRNAMRIFVAGATGAVGRRLVPRLAEAGHRRPDAQVYPGWTNIREGGPLKTEEDPLDPTPPKNMTRTLEAIRYLERTVTSTPDVEGVALRYGSFYGPHSSLGEDGEYPA